MSSRNLVFVWMPHTKSFVEITQKSDIISQPRDSATYALKGGNRPLGGGEPMLVTSSEPGHDNR